MLELLRDVRFALRLWRRDAAVAAVVVTTLALGIGATTAVCGVVDAVLLSPLPYPAAHRLVAVHEVLPDGDLWTLSMPDFVDIRQQVGTFDALAVHDPGSVTVHDDDGPRRVDGTRISNDFFRMLGLPMAHGRELHADDLSEGAPPTVVLGHAYWRERFAGDPGVVGTTMGVDGQRHTVVGIAPPGVRLDGDEPALWLPWTITEEGLRNRGGHMYPVIGRLAEDATLEAARQELAAVFEDIVAASPRHHEEGRSTILVPLREQILGDTGEALWTLGGAVAMLLLIACANVAHLLLSRSDLREREIAVRAALGAGSRRLAAQLVVESLVLAVGGGLLGVGLAAAGMYAAGDVLAAALPRAAEVDIDLRVLAFATGLMVVTGCGLGVVPAARATRGDLQSPLRGGARGQVGAGRRLLPHRGLVVVEVALALMLSLGAGLLIRSLSELYAVDRGFRAGGALTLRTSLPASRYDTPEAAVAALRRIHEELAALPGVEAVGAIGLLPFFADQSTSLAVAGRPDGGVRSEFRQVTPGIFEALGTRVLQGRGFTSADVEDAPPVIVLSQALARRLFPDGDAVGSQVATSWGSHPDSLEVVGVVEDVHMAGLDVEPPPAMYWPLGQYDWRSSVSWVLRVPAGPDEEEAAVLLAGPAREAVQRVDPELPVYSVESLAARMDRSVGERRLLTGLLAGFGAAALLLGAVGVFGVMAYTVGRRRREIGLRVALGAAPPTVLREILGEALKMALAGIVLGSAGALALGRVFGHLLYETRPTDPGTFAAGAALLLGVALTACWLPARRAAHLDPMVALRGE